LGGERIDSDRAVLELAPDATAAGAAGMAIGRNIWQSPKPGGMVRALAAILHEGATVNAAEALLRDAV
jgi:class I fructose-bisphosphate aldolase